MVLRQRPSASRWTQSCTPHGLECLKYKPDCARKFVPFFRFVPILCELRRGPTHRSRAMIRLTMGLKRHRMVTKRTTAGAARIKAVAQAISPWERLGTSTHSHMVRQHHCKDCHFQGDWVFATARGDITRIVVHVSCQRNLDKLVSNCGGSRSHSDHCDSDGGKARRSMAT